MAGVKQIAQYITFMAPFNFFVSKSLLKLHIIKPKQIGVHRQVAVNLDEFTLPEMIWKDKFITILAKITSQCLL